LNSVDIIKFVTVTEVKCANNLSTELSRYIIDCIVNVKVKVSLGLINVAPHIRIKGGVEVYSNIHNLYTRW
jgi:tRNA A37 threonylcarbamoyladenosine dehydratase